MDDTWGGSWTILKLEILQRYLDAYTTALKHKNFELTYIDAFAGSGTIQLKETTDRKEFFTFRDGSARVALKVEDKRFDDFVFIEKDAARVATLRALRTNYCDRRIEILQKDANSYISELDLGRHTRGVIFLDPFSTEVRWKTIEQLANIKALDTWILFPVMAISRLLPVQRKPDEIEQWNQTILTNVYGDQSWRNLYSLTTQIDMFDGEKQERPRGVDGLVEIYKRKLKDLWGPRFLDHTRSLKNSNNSTLFEIMFCTGSNSGAAIAASQRIAAHILGP